MARATFEGRAEDHEATQKEWTMRVLVVGSSGCIGSAVARALRSRGHEVVCGSRAGQGAGAMHIDYAQPVPPAEWARRLRAERIEAVVNCVGVLMQRRGQTFARVHAQGPIELFGGAALAGVKRVVQVSALGVDEQEADPPAYLASKREADRALAVLPLAHAIVRPSLVYGPGSASATLFATLASLPVVSLPGGGTQQVQPIHVYEVAEAITRWLELDAPDSGVLDLAGPTPISYRDMLHEYRRALALGAALWLSVPMPLMRAGALLAEALPQKVFCRDTLRLLGRGNTTSRNAVPRLLRRAPSALGVGLRVTPPTPWLDLRVSLGPAASWLLRAAVAFMWLYTALVSALLPHESGVLRLLERCGFTGDAGTATLIASCALNIGLGLAVLTRHGAWTYAVQMGAVLGYTATAALNMPELTIDHCGPLVKNLPLLAALLVLWLSAPERGSAAPRWQSDESARNRAPAHALR
jgi:uncharacterized protein YbjT (DUF2867 family)